MSCILIMSEDDSIGQELKKAFSSSIRECEVICGSPDANAMKIEDFAALNVDLILVKISSDVIKEEFFQAILTRCRSEDIPVLFLLEDQMVSGEFHPDNLPVSDYLTGPVVSRDVVRRGKFLIMVKRRIDQLRDQAVVDELTGVFNRRYLHEQLNIRLGESRRYSTPFSFILFDIDHFKAINDTYGHWFGDAVLKNIAEVVMLQLRKQDILARYGGEEFAVMLPYTDFSGANILAERVRKSVSESTHTKGEHTAGVTVSLGVASVPKDKLESVEDLIVCADSRLYKAKKSGRNQSVFE